MRISRKLLFFLWEIFPRTKKRDIIRIQSTDIYSLGRARREKSTCGIIGRLHIHRRENYYENESSHQGFTWR